jgi:hypothetical protein
MADLSNFFEEGFDDSSVKASTGIPDPLPVGNYSLMAEKSEIAETKDRTGVMLKMQLAVATGQYEGQKIFVQFNIRNKNAQAQAIGLGGFKALCLAAGVSYDIAKLDTDSLNHIPFNAVVGMEKANINPTTGQPYAPRNRVTKYIPAGEAVAAAPVALAPIAAAVARAPQAGTPWAGGATAAGGGPLPF